VWRTNRKGQLIAHPMPGDTFHADEFYAGAYGEQYDDPDPVVFAWNATTEAAGAVAYATDEANQFGFEDDERGVINHVHIEYPYGSYDSDSPTSVQRYGRRTRADSWLVENDDVADVILNSRSFATMQARPMFTTVELAGFWPDVPKLDVTHPIEIVHSTAAGRAILTAEARVRSISE